MGDHAESSTSHQKRVIHIFDITIRLSGYRQLRSVRLSINDDEQDVTWKEMGKEVLYATFEPSLKISGSDRLTLALHTSLPQIGTSSISDRAKPIPIPVHELVRGHEQGQRKWKQSFGKAEITIRLIAQPPGPTLYQDTAGFSHVGRDSVLVPTTDEIARICPRFRILVAGRTGVGKSSLINSAFGVSDALVSHDKVGVTDINREILSTQNERFVLHDSQGFEPGEITNPGTVRGFISIRNKMPDLKDKLHAIWICIAIPVAGGRIFEVGLEDLFQLKQEGNLGNAPIIAVFTKFDELVPREMWKLATDKGNKLDTKEIQQKARENAEEAFKEDCLKVFQETVGTQIPYKAVSTQDGYESTLSDLIQITFDNVKEHVAKEASIVTAIAQKVSASVKIEGSIDVGKRRYWAGLASSINFPGKTLKTCLDVIHSDIINVWNLEDPYGNLESNEFKALLSHLIGNKARGNAALKPTKHLGAGLAMVGAMACIVSAISGPAAPIVIPIAGGLVLAVWAYEVYKVSRHSLEHLMVYIIDLTLVMQNVFWLAEGKHPTSRRLIKIAFIAYSDSITKVKVHRAVANYVKQTTIYSPGGRDVTLEKIVEIINRYQIDSAEMWKLKGKIPPFHASGPDEPWDPPRAAT